MVQRRHPRDTYACRAHLCVGGQIQATPTPFRTYTAAALWHVADGLHIDQSARILRSNTRNQLLRRCAQPSGRDAGGRSGRDDPLGDAPSTDAARDRPRVPLACRATRRSPVSGSDGGPRLAVGAARWAFAVVEPICTAWGRVPKDLAYWFALTIWQAGTAERTAPPPPGPGRRAVASTSTRRPRGCCWRGSVRAQAAVPTGGPGPP